MALRERRGRSRARGLAAAAALLALIALAGPAHGATAPSQGCQAWNALGADGWTTSVASVAGPFKAGETLRYTIDDTSIGDVFYLTTGSLDFLYTTTHTGIQTYTLTKDVTSIDFNGGGSPPATWYLSNFACFPAGVMPPTDTQGSAPVAAAGDNTWLAVVALVLLVGSLVVVRPRRR